MKCALSEDETRLAADVATRRQLATVFHGQRDRHGAEHRLTDQWAVNINAAGAEIAAAKALGRYWTGLNPLAAADIGDDIQVRSTLKPENRCLLVRPNDPDDHYFVLVTGTLPRYELAGWIPARDAKQARWRRDPNGHGSCFLVPPEALRDVREITALKPNPAAPAHRPFTDAELDQMAKEIGF